MSRARSLVLVVLLGCIPERVHTDEPPAGSPWTREGREAEAARSPAPTERDALDELHAEWVRLANRFERARQRIYLARSDAESRDVDMTRVVDLLETFPMERDRAQRNLDAAFAALERGMQATAREHLSNLRESTERARVTVDDLESFAAQIEGLEPTPTVL